MIPSSEFLRNMGKASVVAGIILLAVAYISDWFGK